MALHIPTYTYSRRYTGSVQACILDWAGTTIDHGSLAPTNVFKAAFAAFGVMITDVEARGPMGRGKLDHIRDLGTLPAIAERWQAAQSRPFTEEDAVAVYEEFLPRQIKVAGEHAVLIDGVVEAVATLRARGIRIGSTTGYTKAIMEAVVGPATEQGYIPDALVCSDDVAAGRPAPYLIHKALEQIDVWPCDAVVKVGDTVTDMEDALNAGCWGVGIIETGSEMGLSKAALEALPSTERSKRHGAVSERLAKAGAHLLIDSIADLPAAVQEINRRLQRGERP
ncbi:MAG: phosphonoacetaldehyde hydrolase [Rhodospirillaceae bacterium]